MVQQLPQMFLQADVAIAPARSGRSCHAIGFSDQWRNQWQTRRASPLIPGKGKKEGSKGHRPAAPLTTKTCRMHALVAGYLPCPV